MRSPPITSLYPATLANILSVKLNRACINGSYTVKGVEFDDSIPLRDLCCRLLEMMIPSVAGNFWLDSAVAFRPRVYVCAAPGGGRGK